LAKTPSVLKEWLGELRVLQVHQSVFGELLADEVQAFELAGGDHVQLDHVFDKLHLRDR